MIIFYNKTDLFDAKISNLPLTTCWPTFNEPYNSKATANFIKEKFENTFEKSTSKSCVYTYFTCAIDINNMQSTFDAMNDIVINKNLLEAGLF